MSPNPFAPPNSNLTRPPDAPAVVPREIFNAIYLLTVSWVLGLLTLLPGIRVERPEDAEVPLIVIVLWVGFISALMFWFLYSLYRRRNWARWAILALCALGWWSTGTDLQENFTQSPLHALIEIVSVALDLAACRLFLLGDGARWLAGVREQA